MKQKFSAWGLFVASRFSSVDKKGRFGRATQYLSSLGIAFGVMTLITVLSVMDGFQLSYIDAILELSSSHIRVSCNNASAQAEQDFLQFVSNHKDVRAVNAFLEGQSLISDGISRQQGAVIRAVMPSIIQTDKGFERELKMISGSFDLNSANAIVLGSELASMLNVAVGSTVNLLALSGESDVGLLDENRIFTVTGIFSSGYAEINSTFAFVSLATKDELFGRNAKILYGIKLFNEQKDFNVIKALSAQMPQFDFESWRTYNRAFFGALRVEKNMLMVLVFLIFVVVGVSIYNGMRRMVFMRKEDICILCALGAKPFSVQSIFIFQGFIIGFVGTLLGCVLGLFLSINVDEIFMLFSRIQYWVQYALLYISSRELAQVMKENMLYNVYASIPARIILKEVVLICLFGIASALLASWYASRSVLKLSVAEVLRDE